MGERYEFIAEDKIKIIDSDEVVDEGDIVHDIGNNTDLFIKDFYKNDTSVFYRNQYTGNVEAENLEEFARLIDIDLYEVK